MPQLNMAAASGASSAGVLSASSLEKSHKQSRVQLCDICHKEHCIPPNSRDSSSPKSTFAGAQVNGKPRWEFTIPGGTLMGYLYKGILLIWGVLFRVPL